MRRRCCTTPRDRFRLEHIREAALDAISFAKDSRREDLDENRMLSYAIARCLEIIGEAAGQLSEEVWALAPEVPWMQIVGMRDRLAHAYFAINLDYLWGTADEDLRPLLTSVQRLLSDPDPSTDA